MSEHEIRERIQDLKAILNHGGSYPMTEGERELIEDEIRELERSLPDRITNPWAWS